MNKQEILMKFHCPHFCNCFTVTGSPLFESVESQSLTSRGGDEVICVVTWALDSR